MKSAVVVDTNVPIVTNGDSEQASPKCVTACVERLRKITVLENERLALDNRWLIIREYQRNLRSEGQPGFGDAFLKWVLTNRANPDRCEYVSITPIDNYELDFVEFPRDPELTCFDLADRKFVAVALTHAQRPPILQAMDSKWWNYKDALRRNGVEVEFLCEEDISPLI